MHISKNKVTALEYRGLVISQQNEIKQAFITLRKNLFNDAKLACEITMRKFLDAMAEIPEDSGEPINKDVMKEEIARAINDLPPRKSPGIDGIGAAVHKPVFQRIGSHSTNCACRRFEKKITSILVRQPLTVLIPKK